MFLGGPIRIDHVACGCRPHMGMCGNYSPEVTSIEFPEFSADPRPRQWCDQCLVVWNTSGCGNCGCREVKLCALCRMALPAAADRP